MKLLPCLLALCALCSSFQARADEFTIVLYESPATLDRRTGPVDAAYWQAYNDVAAAMAQAGVLRGGSALASSPGPERGRPAALKSSSPRLSGYFVIDVADLASARLWAARMPASALLVEVRPHVANPTMAARK